MPIKYKRDKRGLNQLQRRREELDLTQEEMAVLANSSQGKVSRLECGRDPHWRNMHMETAQGLAKAYRMTLPEFMAGAREAFDRRNGGAS